MSFQSDRYMSLHDIQTSEHERVYLLYRLPKQEPVPGRYNGTQYFLDLLLAKLNKMRAFKIHLAANLKEPVVNRTIHYVLLFMYAYTYIYLYRTKLIKRISTMSE